jgi:tetraacyldisaccharide 4'-kinase
MEQWLTRMWYREPAGPSLLAPLGWLYWLVWSIRRLAYAAGLLRAHGAGRPVIVVGNLTVGGTGKTPLVAWLADRLSASGLKVGIVSRGYGGSGRTPQAVHTESDWRSVGDEPWLLHQLTGCDTVVARDRVAGARELVKLGADVVIADDGLQHLRLARECEIVVIDGARGFGNGRLLPAGPLREPASRLRSANILVVNGACEHPSLEHPDNASTEPVFEMMLSGGEAHRVDGLAGPQPLDHFRGQRVHAVAGIGNPQRFFKDLRARGIDVMEHPFADHHPFVAADLTFGDGLAVLMTEKDAVKCRSIANAQLWYVPVAARFSDQSGRELLNRVVSILAPTTKTTSLLPRG